MRKSIVATAAILVCASMLAPLGCYRSADPGDDTDTTTGADLDTDTDADTDVDTGTDVDTDADVDTDTDGDADSDADSDSDPDDDCAVEVPTGVWGNACDPSGAGSECAPDTTCVTLDGTTGYCAPQCCALGEVDSTYCTDVTGGVEQCAVHSGTSTVPEQPFYCAIVCETEGDCPDGTACMSVGTASICAGFADTDTGADAGADDDG
jgi:hypothetical protein